MATFQSEHGKRRLHVPTPEQAGQVTLAKFEYTFAAAFAFATDRVELGVLPAGAEVCDFIVKAEGLNGDITLGIMSGDVGDASDARTVDATLLPATTMTTGVHRPATIAPFNIAKNNDKDRSIGLTGSANIAAGGAKKITLYLFYTL